MLKIPEQAKMLFLHVAEVEKLAHYVKRLMEIHFNVFYYGQSLHVLLSLTIAGIKRRGLVGAPVNPESLAWVQLGP